MRGHHRESIERLKECFRGAEGVLAVILAGSVAKGLEREDSDIDAIVVVDGRRYAELAAQGRLSECVWGRCTYEGGYFDIKYVTLDYLEDLSARGSEPSRSAFEGARCVLGGDGRIGELVGAIPTFQDAERGEKMLSFHAALSLNEGYFWGASDGDAYLRARVVSDIVLYGLRLVLQWCGVLFPCHKALMGTVSGLGEAQRAIATKAEGFLRDPNDGTKSAFVAAVKGFVGYEPPKDYNAVLTRYVDDNERWWHLGRPNIAEW
ncbi:MAG: nucleotidyltransferase domain-containing protein [Oscillospiraceae bacterium]|nr:nucleotidyltransferase domain-containing protein [Oscillospiraceae bacterium]